MFVCLRRHVKNYNATNPTATEPVEQALYDTIPENPQTDTFRRLAANREIINHDYQELVFANQLPLNHYYSEPGMYSVCSTV